MAPGRSEARASAADVADDDELNGRVMALLEKQRKLKEQASMEKLLIPSNSLRSLYSGSTPIKMVKGLPARLVKSTNISNWNYCCLYLDSS